MPQPTASPLLSASANPTANIARLSPAHARAKASRQADYRPQLRDVMKSLTGDGARAGADPNHPLTMDEGPESSYEEQLRLKYSTEAPKRVGSERFDVMTPLSAEQMRRVKWMTNENGLARREGRPIPYPNPVTLVRAETAEAAARAAAAAAAEKARVEEEARKAREAEEKAARKAARAAEREKQRLIELANRPTPEQIAAAAERHRIEREATEKAAAAERERRAAAAAEAGARLLAEQKQKQVEADFVKNQLLAAAGIKAKSEAPTATPTATATATASGTVSGSAGPIATAAPAAEPIYLTPLYKFFDSWADRFAPLIKEEESLNESKSNRSAEEEINEIVTRLGKRMTVRDLSHELKEPMNDMLRELNRSRDEVCVVTAA